MSKTYKLVSNAISIDCGAVMPVYSDASKGWVTGTQVISDANHDFHVVTTDVMLYPTMPPMQFYLAFTPDERIAIKASTLSRVMEFWDTYQRAERTGTPIDPNSPAVQAGLGYLTLATNATPIAGAGILAAGRMASILAGIPQ